MKTIANKKLFTLASMMLVLVWVTMSFDSSAQDKAKPWKVSEEFKAKKNPFAPGKEGADPASIAAGKALYAKHCKSCHGVKGLGDGPKSEELDTPSGDFSTKEFQAQTDGELYHKIKEGRDDMPTFSKKFTDDAEFWNVVNYLRTLGK